MEKVVVLILPNIDDGSADDEDTQCGEEGGDRLRRRGGSE